MASVIGLSGFGMIFLSAISNEYTFGEFQGLETVPRCASPPAGSGPGWPQK
jgi:hypothetical protein